MSRSAASTNTCGSSSRRGVVALTAVADGSDGLSPPITGPAPA
ncbi:hypothetical protein OV079_20810 [Nannocystis pusilla]|uniref:Uncharacterized protein n=1 Tax=Nannocystis pusilla TaxID=889268 RepID=A0A9X3EPL7_9BACT|nr:hypothetical protein [Nannocystis pusilla]MCY1007952.1 hypothetical protein [Nannocystis pusilla]